MRNKNKPDPADHDSWKRREREFDAVTFVLASILAAIILGAVGYGILNSSRGTTAIPSPTTGLQKPAQFAKPLPEQAPSVERATTGTSGASR